MNKYRVFVRYEGCVEFEIEAQKEREAEDEALELFAEMPDEDLVLNLGDHFVEGVEKVND